MCEGADGRSEWEGWMDGWMEWFASISWIIAALFFGFNMLLLGFVAVWNALSGFGQNFLCHRAR